MYRPKAINELRTPVKLLVPTYTRYNGVATPTYPKDGDVIFVNWKTYGGTEQTVNGVYSIRDTADITTWYRPDIKANCCQRDGLHRTATQELYVMRVSRALIFACNGSKIGEQLKMKIQIDQFDKNIRDLQQTVEIDGKYRQSPCGNVPYDKDNTEGAEQKKLRFVLRQITDGVQNQQIAEEGREDADPIDVKIKIDEKVSPGNRANAFA